MSEGHNHITREIRPLGSGCPACDRYHQRVSPPKRVIVTGSRGWTDDIRIGAELSRTFGEIGPFILVHGDARGADRIAAAIHSRGGWEVEAHPAEWRPHGVYNPQAGLARNHAMLALGADLVLAFWDGSSTGTKHMIDAAQLAGVPVRIIRENPAW